MSKQKSPREQPYTFEEDTMITAQAVVNIVKSTKEDVDPVPFIAVLLEDYAKRVRTTYAQSTREARATIWLGDVEVTQKYARLTIYTDGASRGNPGNAAAGVHIIDENLETVADLSVALGTATNNEAEYQALLQAVEWLLERKELLADAIQIRFRLDSKLVVSQLIGKYEIKDAKMQLLAGEVRERLHQLPGTYTFEHIPREDNKEADALANDALDRLG